MLNCNSVLTHFIDRDLKHRTYLDTRNINCLSRHHSTGTKHSVDAFSIPYLSFNLFYLVLTLALVVNIVQTKSYNDMPVKNEKCTLEQLRDLRLKNPRKVTIGHVNINSIPLDGIMDLITPVLHHHCLLSFKNAQNMIKMFVLISDISNWWGKTEYKFSYPLKITFSYN